jgi:hypothetical protein
VSSTLYSSDAGITDSNGQQVSTSIPGSGLLLENGTGYLVLEDAYFEIVLPPVTYNFFLENGNGYLLLNDGALFELEVGP